MIEGRRNKPDAKPHHIIVRKNVVSKMPGGGITSLGADHITIEDNFVVDNAWFMVYAGSGITFLDSWAHDDKPGYHIVIQRNKVCNQAVRWDYNLYPVEQNVVRGPNDIVADPQFVRVDRDLRKADFRLAKGSRALDSGTAELPQPQRPHRGQAPARRRRGPRRLRAAGSMQRHLAAAALVLASAAGAEDLKFAGKFRTEQQIMAPDCMALKWSQKPGDLYGCTPAQVNAWRERLVQWRTERLRAIKYDDSRYRNPALQWAATSFVQPQAMVHDRYLYDPVAGRNTVDRYLDDLERR